MTLPDCMMPDGVDPCDGYKALQAERDASRAAEKAMDDLLVKETLRHGRELSEVVQERDALAAQVKGEKLWEERCADLEAQIVAMREVCEAVKLVEHHAPLVLRVALRKWREQEGK